MEGAEGPLGDQRLLDVSDAAHDEHVYLQSQPLGLCPDDLPLATGTTLRWSKSRQTKTTTTKKQNVKPSMDGEAETNKRN